MMKDQKRQFNKPQDEFESKLLDLTRVTRVTAGGKQLRFRAIIVVGDRKGKIGLGVSKGLDVSQAIDKATKVAKKNLMIVPINKEGGIDHEVEAKFGPSVILLKPQKKGKGLMAGGAVRTLCQLAGIQDVSSKVLSRTKNKLNNAKATIKAFELLARQI
ncbi:MAG: 30S ribosomal protein S5 [Candidatus Pacebacteria bacterium]|nr:30S ribosomal protein S5 [Candidatus Paceibacterota bacterium]MDD3919075.1 30S ribosomal protein S5 [Candidatus Paceibacterota bacterium]